MQNKYPFFKYIKGTSKIHNMNSKFKIANFLFMLLLIILMRDYVSFFMLLLCILYLMMLSKINIKAYLENTLIFWPIYILVLVLSFMLTGNIYLSLVIMFKPILILLLFLLLTFTTSLSEIAWGFECLFIKLKKIKVPVSKISLRIALNIKFVATLFEQFRNIRKSMAYRGVSYGNSRIITFFKMFFPVVNLSYKLSRRMVATMKLRFYGSTNRRTNYHENKETKFDKFLIAYNFLVLYFIIWLGYYL